VYITPKRLRKGSRVAIVAPSSPIVSDRLVEGIDIIKEMGLIPVLGPCVRNLKSDGLHAAPLKDRVDELNWAFSDSQIAGVICAVGGMGSAGVLPYLDYQTIQKTRKPMLGRSDITALNTGLLTHSGLITISSQTPSIKVDKGEQVRSLESESFAKTLELMMTDQVWESIPFNDNPYIPRTVSPGSAKGHVIGGNIDTFSRLLGTPHFPDCNGAILFVEDVHKDGEVLAREFLHMKLAGVLDAVNGIVIGEFVDSKKKTDAKVPDIEDVIQEYFSDGPPCVYGYSFSHGSIVSPIPIGADCEMDAETGEVNFHFAMGT
jgi:muramoyltetrapeptide carboxypeptidase